MFLFGLAFIFFNGCGSLRLSGHIQSDLVHDTFTEARRNVFDSPSFIKVLSSIAQDIDDCRFNTWDDYNLFFEDLEIKYFLELSEKESIIIRDFLNRWLKEQNKQFHSNNSKSRLRTEIMRLIAALADYQYNRPRLE